MVRFSGLEIKPYSQLTDLPKVRIDRVRVEVQRTLFGEVEYHLVGTYGDEGKAYPICAPFAELPDVWEKKREVEGAIYQARAAARPEPAQGTAKEKYHATTNEAGYMETPEGTV